MEDWGLSLQRQALSGCPVVDLPCPECGKFSSSGLARAFLRRQSLEFLLPELLFPYAFPNNLYSVLLDFTGWVLLFPIAGLETSGCVLGLLTLCSCSQGVLALGKHLEGCKMREHG